MNSNELANLVEMTIRSQHAHSIDLWSEVDRCQLEEIIDLCRDGIMGPGKQQYESNGRQKFEDMTLVALVDYVREESRDLINYGVMVTWRMDQISLALVELSRRKEIQNLVQEGKIVAVVATDMSNLNELADSIDSYHSTLPKSDPPIS